MAAIVPPWLRATDQCQVTLVNSVNSSALALQLSPADASALAALPMAWTTGGYAYILRFTGTAAGDHAEFVYATNVNTGTGVVTLGTLSPPANVPPGRAALLATQYPANTHPSGALLELRYTAEQVTQLQNAVDAHDHTGSQGNGPVLTNAGLPTTLSSRTLDNTNTVILQDTNFSIQDNGNPTRVMQFEASGITLGNTRTMTIPDASGTLVLNTNVMGITNKTLDDTNTVTLKDTLFTIHDNVDTTKQFQFEATNIATGTVRTYAWPNANGTVTLDANITTVSNKNFDNSNAAAFKGGTNFTLQDATTVSKQVQFDMSGISTSTTRTLAIPNASGTLTLRDDTATFSNKTMDNTCIVVVKDTNFTLQDDGNVAKQLQFQLSGLSATLRTLTVPDVSGTLTVLGNASTGSGSVVLATSPSLTTPTLSVPVIADFTSAAHNHNNVANANTVDHASLTSKGTNTHAAIDTAVTASTTHIASAFGVHGITANSFVLGNRSATGESIQRGHSANTTGESTFGSGPTMYKSTTSITFAQPFTAAPVVLATPSVSSAGNAPIFARAESVATTAFTLMLGSPQTGTVGTTTGDWVAIGVPTN